MGGGTGDSSICHPDKDDDRAEAAESFADVPLSDAPILLLVYFHKALRQEIATLCQLAVRASESGARGSHGGLITELRRRFDFLKLAYKYHCAAEDEVIFLALDIHIKNVACSYSLEHESIDNLFNCIPNCLNLLEEEIKNIEKSFQELLSCLSTMQSSIYEHMLKEEEQVFPLLIQQFSPKEQSSLVWQFICSVPIILLKELLPWMISFLSPGKQVEVVNCIIEISPKEKSLQEVLISWLHRSDQCHHYTPDGSENLGDSGLEIINPQLNSYKRALKENWKWMKPFLVQTNLGSNPVGHLYLMHTAIQKDLEEILKELHLIRSSNVFANVDSIVIRLKFLADVIIFYSNALKRFFYPVLNQVVNHQFSPSSGEQCTIDNHLKSLHQLLHHNAQIDVPLINFVENLCPALDSLAIDISKQFHFEATEVFPLISKNCSNQKQQKLLYMSLQVMPLGLIKCVISWFTAHLSQNEFGSIHHSINQGDPLANKPFASLLLEWFHAGYSGKTSVENHVKDLQKIFKNRCSLLTDQIEDVIGCCLLDSNMQSCKESNPIKLEPDFTDKGKRILSYSSSGPHNERTYKTSYSSAINLHVFFPGILRTVHRFPKLHGEESSTTSSINETRPMDLIFFFHKALKKDLEYLVSGSGQLAEDSGFLADFCQHFQLLQSRYQFHSDAEDEIAFPALEAKGKVTNISHSYSIDHKLEVKHFAEISLILEEMSKLHLLDSSVHLNTHDQKMIKHSQLCAKLHRMCKSMHRLLSDHVHREEIELWPLFREFFSIQEQEKIIGCMLGRTRAEMLQDMIPWLMSSLTSEEQHSMMSLLHEVTKNTMFDEWLQEWWEENGVAVVAEELNASCTADPLEIIEEYLSQESPDKQGDNLHDKGIDVGSNIYKFEKCKSGDKAKVLDEDHNSDRHSECMMLCTESDSKKSNEGSDVIDKKDKSQHFRSTLKEGKHGSLLTMSQDDLEAAIRRVSCDSSLEPQKKSYIIQNLLTSRWIARQRIFHKGSSISSNGEKIPGQHPSFRDPLKLTFGCKHYKRNCKLVTACCNQLHTCIRCHDEVADHSIDRRTIKKMMCMKCLVIQPIGHTCSTVSCNNLSMGRYYCRICKLFDDEREIYHCPYCNLCRLGKGLGIEYFHCMTCNACMSWSLSIHICREKSLEDNCPICHEYIFTSSNPVKALACGHVMHSMCFQDYTHTHYTCPICSKSLGDMQVYFKMLDALLAEEKVPDEFSSKTQFILCNDCEKKGAASFHWLYHKCPYCGSYNTRLF